MGHVNYPNCLLSCKCLFLLPENLQAVPRSCRMVTTWIKGWPAGERGVTKMTQIVCVLSNGIKQQNHSQTVVWQKKVRKWACNATTTTVSFICMTITIHHCKSVESMIITVIQLSRYNCNIDVYHNIYPLSQKWKGQINLSLISKHDEMNTINWRFT